MTTIYWLESFSEEEETVKQLAENPDDIVFHEAPVQDLSSDEFDDECIFCIRTHSVFDPKHIAHAECVISRSTGYDHLLEQQNRLSGIPVGHLSEYATEAVSSYNLSLAFSLLKKIPKATRAVETFHRSGLTGDDLVDRNCGIVGVGKIGGTTAEHLINLGMNVSGNDLQTRSRFEASNEFNYINLEELFETCDLIFLCLPHTDQTEELIDRALLDRLPGKSILVNTGRGEVVTNQSLLQSLNKGNLEGLGLDVYNAEEKLAEHLQNRSIDSESNDPEVEAARQLIRDERVIATPHNAFNSRHALRKKVQLTLDNISTFQRNGELLSPVEL